MYCTRVPTCIVSLSIAFIVTKKSGCDTGACGEEKKDNRMCIEAQKVIDIKTFSKHSAPVYGKRVSDYIVVGKLKLCIENIYFFPDNPNLTS